MQKIIVLGASGTIGQNTIDIIRKFPSRFELAGVSVHTKTDVLNALRAEFHFNDDKTICLWIIGILAITATNDPNIFNDLIRSFL